MSSTRPPSPQPQLVDTSDTVMHALSEHVPLTLLLDLSSPVGPESQEISRTEGGDASWLIR